MNSNLEGRWLRKCSAEEVKMAEKYLRGQRLWYQLNLSSLQPLREDDVRKALVHLYKKTPNLPVCYGLRDGECWLKQASRSDIDFKILDNDSLETVTSSLNLYQFNTEEGPMICARLLTNAYNEDEDLEPNFPHKYYFLFGVHHILVDGTSLMDICGSFVGLINDVISNVFVDDSQILGSFLTDEETLKLIKEKTKLIIEDPRLEQQLSKEHQFNKHHRPLTLKLSNKKNGSNEAINLFEVIDKKTTSRLLARIKQEEVTLNSLISSVVNVALIETLSEKGVVQDSYLLQELHSVNLRRYWTKNSSKTHGYHVGFPLIFSANTPRDVRNHFWDYVKNKNSVMKHDVESGKILLNEAYKKTLLDNGNSQHSSKFSEKFEGDYATSSLGDVTDIVTIGGENVRITSVRRSAGVLGTTYPLIFSTNTFRGRFMISFGFNTEVLNLETGKRVHSKVIRFIEKLSG